MHYSKHIYIKKKEITTIFTLLYFSCKIVMLRKTIIYFFQFMASFVCYEALQQKILVPR